MGQEQEAALRQEVFRHVSNQCGITGRGAESCGGDALPPSTIVVRKSLRTSSKANARSCSRKPRTACTRKSVAGLYHDWSLKGNKSVNVAPKQIVLAYSGGLDTAVIMRWLIETYHCPVVAFVANVGQQEDLGSHRTKKRNKLGHRRCAWKTCARRLHATSCSCPARPRCVRGDVLARHALARPLIAKTQVEIARRVGADTVSHGATGKGN